MKKILDLAGLRTVVGYIKNLSARVGVLENPGYELVATKPTASSNTVGKIYLIDKGSGIYERWITVNQNGDYTWLQLSDLGNLNLSGYVKAVILTQDEYDALSIALKNNGDYYFIVED